MSGALSLVGLLTQVVGAELAFRREDDLLAAAVLSLPVGRQMLLIERTYRDGIGVLLDPTPKDLEVARTTSVALNSRVARDRRDELTR